MTGESEFVSELAQLSGWILPDGTWQACEDWWHLTSLYDLRDEGHNDLTTTDAREVLHRGREDEIRDLAANLGFIRISRSLIDGHALTSAQLQTLQRLIEFCDPDAEVEVLNSKENTRVRMTVARIIKLRNSSHFFDEVDRL